MNTLEELYVFTLFQTSVCLTDYSLLALYPMPWFLYNKSLAPDSLVPKLIAPANYCIL